MSRIAVQRNASQRFSFPANDILQSTDRADEGPTYSAADLTALRDSTPITSKNDEQSELGIDVRDKFGTSLARYQDPISSAIPSAEQIAEKKERRARLALESKAEEYISLDPDDPGWQEDDDGNIVRDMAGRLVLKEKDTYGIQQSRLVRDDEDMMEGFDEYTGDTGSRVIMGESMKPVNQQARRTEISKQIAQAEDDSDSDSQDESDRLRNDAYEAAQIRHGTYANHSTDKQDRYAHLRAKTPPIITPLPSLEAVLGRLRASLVDLESRKKAKEAEMARLTDEKFKIRDEETRIQQQLKDVGEKFRQIKIEKGFLTKDDPLPSTELVTITDTVNASTPEPDAEANDGERGREALAEEEAGEEEEAPRLGLGAGNFTQSLDLS